MVGWHHRLDGHKFEQAPGDSEREAWSATVHGVAKSQTQRLSNGTRTKQCFRSLLSTGKGQFPDNVS